MGPFPRHLPARGPAPPRRLPRPDPEGAPPVQPPTGRREQQHRHSGDAHEHSAERGAGGRDLDQRCEPSARCEARVHGQRRRGAGQDGDRPRRRRELPGGVACRAQDRDGPRRPAQRPRASRLRPHARQAHAEGPVPGGPAGRRRTVPQEGPVPGPPAPGPRRPRLARRTRPGPRRHHPDQDAPARRPGRPRPDPEPHGQRRHRHPHRRRHPEVGPAPRGRPGREPRRHPGPSGGGQHAPAQEGRRGRRRGDADRTPVHAPATCGTSPTPPRRTSRTGRRSSPASATSSASTASTTRRCSQTASRSTCSAGPAGSSARSCSSSPAAPGPRCATPTR